MLVEDEGRNYTGPVCVELDRDPVEVATQVADMLERRS
jgi:hypothetical protein